MLAIRRAGRNDEAAILGLWKQLIQYHRSIEAFRPERWKLPPEEAIRPRLTAGWEHSQTRAAFIAEMEGRPLGFVYTQLKESGHCPANIDSLFVEANERNRGGGQALLDPALNWCQAHGANEISLDCIWPNDLARRFYENRRFRPLLVTYVLRLGANEAVDKAVIRAATAADVPVVTQIVEQAYRHYIPRMGKPPGPMLDDYSARISEQAVWVIEEGTAIAAILVLLPKPDHLLLDSIAVSPLRQGLGFGRRLLTFAETDALRRGYREIRLYTHETMTENQRLYAQSATRKPGVALRPDTSASLCGSNFGDLHALQACDPQGAR